MYEATVEVLTMYDDDYGREVDSNSYVAEGSRIACPWELGT